MSPSPRRFGPFILLAPVPDPGRGEAYLALAARLGAEGLVVVRHLGDQAQADDSRRRDLEEEGRLAVQLRHDNLVATLSTGEVAGRPYIVQELLDGGTLAQAMDRLAVSGDRLPVAASVHIARSLCRGLALVHAHAGQGLVHREVFPPHVHLSHDGRVKLLGAGRARPRTARVAVAESGGRLGYLAPEQVAGGDIDCRTDVHAVGVLLWEMLTGQRLGARLQAGVVVPPARERQAIVERILHDAPPPPSLFAAGITPTLDKIVQRALAKRPDDRFDDASEMGAALEAVLDDEGAGELAVTVRTLFDPQAERARRDELVRAAARLLAQPSESTAVIGLGGYRRWAAIAGAGALGLLALVMIVLELSSAGSRLAGPAPSAPMSARPALAPPPPLPPVVPPETTAMEQIAPVPPETTAMEQVAPVPPETTAMEQVAPVPPAIEEVTPARRPTAALVRTPGAEPTPMPTQTMKADAGVAATAAVDDTGPDAAAAAPPPAIDVAALVDQARAAFARGALDDSVRLGREAVLAGSGDAYAVLGAAYFKLGRLADAEQSYAEALRRSPGDERLARRLALVRQRASHDGGPEKSAQ